MIQTMAIRLKSEVVTHIRKSLDLKNRLQLELKISTTTLNRLLNANGERLTTATALKIIADELGKSNDELLTESE